MARAVVQRQQHPVWDRVVEQVFPDLDLLISLDDEPAPRQARVLCFPESDPEGISWRFGEREGAGSR